ncbi:MAG: ribonuclease HII, partial [Gammaproteobacteria bacterium]|nr:ribonuclease HII [Gammaproteobacteria bacterium]
MDAELYIPEGHVAGVDEAGRGPLAGPVIAGAVILDPGQPIAGLRDSKRLSASRRDELYDQITEHALAWGVGRAEVEEIDRINILQATMQAMRRAVEALVPFADHALIDGNRCPDLYCTAQAIIKGDSKIPAISAASILAKVTRDREMIDLDMRYPGYGLAQHKGYPSKKHIEALESLGVTPIHRRSYAPVRRIIERG